MRAFAKTSYFNRPKGQVQVNKKGSVQKGINTIDLFYKRFIAEALKQLILNILRLMESDMHTLKKADHHYIRRRTAMIFKCWKQQSQIPQPYPSMIPSSPPRLQLQLDRIPPQTYRAKSDVKQSFRTPQKSAKSSRIREKFYTPNKQSVKVSTMIPSIEDIHTKKIQKFLKRKVLNILYKNMLFQRHQHYKAQHFRDFYLERQCFFILARECHQKRYKLRYYKNERSQYILRLSLSKWYTFTQANINKKKGIKLLLPLLKILLLRKYFQKLHQKSAPQKVILIPIKKKK